MDERYSAIVPDQATKVKVVGYYVKHTTLFMLTVFFIVKRKTAIS